MTGPDTHEELEDPTYLNDNLRKGVDKHTRVISQFFEPLEEGIFNILKGIQ